MPTLPRSLVAAIAASSLVVLSPLQVAGAELAAGDLESFLDGFFSTALSDHRVPGAAVAVVRDGKIVAARGYGMADLEEERPVVAEETLFPAQSVSKLFAATAVLQLHERGLLDLHEPLHAFVDRPRFDEPITTHHLLTHTAGFDDSYIGLLPRSEDDVMPVADFLEEHRPSVVRPPGSALAYSNYASLFARHALEVVTGTSYEEYVARHLLQPLAMRRSCVLPPPPRLRPLLAEGYLPAGDGYRRTGEDLPGGAMRFRTATGTVATPVTEMAHFMILHLEGGSFRDRRLLEPSTLELMHRSQFTPAPGLPGVAYGFFESRAAGERGLFHYGNGFGYGTLLYLLPEHRTGFYLAHTNSASRIVQAFLAAFLERYFPPPARADPRPVPPAGPAAAELAGYWVPIRRSESTFEKLPFHVFSQLHLEAVDGSTLRSRSPWERSWVRTGSARFQRLAGEGSLLFRRDERGGASTAFLWDAEDPETLTFERVPWYDTFPVVVVALGLFLACFLWAGIGWPLAALGRRLRGRDGPPPTGVRPAATVASLLHLAFVGGMVWTFTSWSFVYPPSAWLLGTLALPLVAAAATAAASVSALRAWRQGTASRARRIHDTAVSAALLLFLPFLWHWRLLGFWL